MVKSYFITAVVVISLLIFSYDFYTRILPEASNTQQSEVASITSQKGAIVLSDNDKQEILSKLGEYDVVKTMSQTNKKTTKNNNKPKVFIMGMEDQLKQQGVLSDLFAGNDKYKLIATFDDNGAKFALLSKQDLVSGKMEKARVNLGESLANYKLTEIKNKSVQLEQGERVVQLQLFKYKQGTNDKQNS